MPQHFSDNLKHRQSPITIYIFTVAVNLQYFFVLKAKNIRFVPYFSDRMCVVQNIPLATVKKAGSSDVNRINQDITDI